MLEQDFSATGLAGVNITTQLPVLNVGQLLNRLSGSREFQMIDFNDKSMALPKSSSYTAAVLAALCETPVSQGGLGVFGEASVPGNSYLEHISSQYGSAGMQYNLERGFTMAKASLDKGSVNANVILVPVRDAYSVTKEAAVAAAGDAGAIVPLSYSGFNSAPLTAKRDSDIHVSLNFGTSPKVYVQTYSLEGASEQVVYVIYIGDIAISEMFKKHFEDLTKPVSTANFAAIDPLIKGVKSPLAKAINQIVGERSSRVIYIQDSMSQWNAQPAGGPLVHYIQGTLYSTNFEVNYLLHTAAPVSVFPVVNSKCINTSSVTMLFYPVIQAMIYEHIFNVKSNWIDKFFSNNQHYSGLGNMMVDVYNKASMFGNNKSQKSCFSELVVGIVNALKPSYTRSSASPAQARASLTQYLNSQNVKTVVGHRI